MTVEVRTVLSEVWAWRRFGCEVFCHYVNM